METVKLFLDTNIVLDFYTGRLGNDDAQKIVTAGQDSRYELCISILTAINVLYVSGKYAPGLQASDIPKLFSILPMDYQQYCKALSLNINDFEDALQISCARANGCRAIVTRDSALLNCGISFPSILSPEEFLHRIGGTR